VGGVDSIINGVHNNCSGGPSGVDPVNYSGLKEIAAAVKAKLGVLKLLF
jgi:hypothetical protein